MLSNTIKLSNHGNTKLIAHRGVSGLECENTAASFIAAGNRTYYGIETDIWRTNDGKFICNHDGRTGRICEVDLVIEQTDYDTLCTLLLKDKDGKTDRAELRLPSLYEYAKICRKYEKIAVTELKSKFTIDEIREIISIISDIDQLQNTCFIAFDIDNLDLVKAVLPSQKCQFLTSNWSDDLPEMLEERGMELDIAYKQLTEERIRACHEHGVAVNCWTVDNPEDAERLISWNVDYITTNILE